VTTSCPRTGRPRTGQPANARSQVSHETNSSAIDPSGDRLPFRRHRVQTSMSLHVVECACGSNGRQEG
jgi:hypothetical protein